MRAAIDRTILTVSKSEGVWRVEHDGEHFGHSREKEVAKAAAHRHARSLQDGGRPCQVQVSGEYGYAAA